MGLDKNFRETAAYFERVGRFLTALVEVGGKAFLLKDLVLSRFAFKEFSFSCMNLRISGSFDSVTL